MKRLAALFRTLTRIDVPYDDPFDQLQARSLSLIIWSLIGLAFLYLVYLVFSNITPAYIPLYVGTVALFVVGLSFVLFLIRRNGLAEARFVIITLSLVVVLLGYVSQPSPAGMLVFVLPVIVSGVLFNRRGTVAITLLSFVALLGITIVGAFGLVSGVLATSSAPLDALGFGIFTVLAAGLILTIFSGGQRIVVRRNLVSTREFLNALAITKSLAQSPSVDHILNEAINAIRDQFGYYYVQAYLLERATGLPVLRARTGYGRRSAESSGDQSAQSDQGQLTSDEFSVINEVLKAGKPLRLTRNDPEQRRSQFLNTTQSELLLPIMWGDKALGLLDVQSVSGDSFTASQTEMLEAIATELGMILANTQLTTDLAKTTKEHEQLTTQLRDASRQLEYLNQEVVVRNWRRYLQSRGDEALGFNWKDGSFSQDSTVTPSLDRAFKASSPEIWDDGDEQVLGVPIVLRGQHLGAMEFRTAKEQGWSSRSLELSRIIAARLALALDNIRLYEQAQILANREQMANQVAARLQTKTDVDALIEIATESFRDALGATRTNIRLGIPGAEVREKWGKVMNPLTAIASLPLRIKGAIALLSGVLLAVVVSIFAFGEYSRAIQPASSTVVESLAHERSEVLSALVNTIVSTVQQIALDPNTTSTYSTLVANRSDAGALNKIQNVFRTILNTEPTYRQIRFVAPDGQVLFSIPASANNNESGEAYFKALAARNPSTRLDDVYIGPLEIEPTARMEVAVVVGANNQKVGYLVVTVDPEGSASPGTQNMFDNLRVVVSPSLGGIISFYLVGTDGRIISPALRPVASNEKLQNTAISLGTRSSTQTTQYISPLTGASVLGFSQPIGRLGMSVVAESRQIDLGGSNETGQFILKLVALLAAGMVVAVLLGLYLESTIFTPTRRLLKSLSVAAQGRLPSNIPVLNQRDEIGQLYLAYDALNDELKKNVQQLEARVTERTRDVEATRDIGQIISSIRNVDDVLREVIDLILARFENIYHAQVFLVDASGEYAILRVSTGEAGNKLLARGHRLAVGSQSVIGQVTVSSSPVVALDTSSSAVHKHNELLSETRAELALPLRSTEGVIGALDLQSKRVDAFTEADIRLFQTMADQLTVAITNARLFQQSQERLAEIEELNRQLIGEAWREYSSARQRTPQAKLAIGADNWSDLQRQAVETRKLAESTNGDVVTIAVPVNLRGEPIGAIELDLPSSAYNENTRQLAHELATRLATAADNARLFEQTQRLADRERLVNDIASKLIEQTDVTQILKIAVREVGYALRVPQTMIRLTASKDSKPYTDAQ